MVIVVSVLLSPTLIVSASKLTSPVPLGMILILALDVDEPGMALRRELVRRLGAEVCFLVDFEECSVLFSIIIPPISVGCLLTFP